MNIMELVEAVKEQQDDAASLSVTLEDDGMRGFYPPQKP